jgi:hypothetical protein
MAVEILSKTDKIYYSINGNNNATKKNWKLYTEPLSINETTEIQAKLTTTEIKVTLCQPTSIKNQTIQYHYKIKIQFTVHSWWN